MGGRLDLRHYCNAGRGLSSERRVESVILSLYVDARNDCVEMFWNVSGMWVKPLNERFSRA
jgi:hypothetical protein